MQTCTSDGRRMVWKVVADKELGNRCVAPFSSAEPRRRVVRRAHVVRHAVAPAEPVSANALSSTASAIASEVASSITASQPSLIRRNTLPEEIEQLIFENVTGQWPLSSFVNALPPDRASTVAPGGDTGAAALAAGIEADDHLRRAARELHHPDKLITNKTEGVADSPGPASLVSAALPSRRATRAKMRPALLM